MDGLYTIADIPQLYKNLLEMYTDLQELYTTTGHDKCMNLLYNIIPFLNKTNILDISNYKSEVKEIYLISCKLLIETIKMEKQSQPSKTIELLKIAGEHARRVLILDPFHEDAIKLFKFSFLEIVYANSEVSVNISFLKDITMYDPCDSEVQYLLATMYQFVAKYDLSITHYKIALGVIRLSEAPVLIRRNDPTIDDNQRAELDAALKHYHESRLKCLHALATIYHDIGDNDQSESYYKEAIKYDENDPDINNQLGILYTENRVIYKAIEHYQKAIENVDKAFISSDKNWLLGSLYTNLGLAKCYECDFTGAINCYDKALYYYPKMVLAYQNKLLDTNYITHLIDDPMYISNLHKDLNKMYPEVLTECTGYIPNKAILLAKNKTQMLKRKLKLRIGFVSGDYINHPVSYFISGILKNINYDIFTVYCYSSKSINTKRMGEMYPKVNWEIVQHYTPTVFKDVIRSHKIDILFDLSSQTNANRLDTFALKPAPIQISYCGYPNSSGLKSMDYRITDKYCDNEKSECYYQEKLVYMNNCFLTYQSNVDLKDLPLYKQPFVKNNYITFGSFNRFNKTNSMVINVWEEILSKVPNSRLIVKTKEFDSPSIRKTFLDTFKDKSILERVTIIPYASSYTEHLLDYNKIDIALDCFPYSGTTTSCEALLMGVPIITLYDNVRHYHSQNVTTSLLKNSDLEDFVAYTREEYIQKAINYGNSPPKDLSNLKVQIRKKFVDGHVCNTRQFVNEFENTIITLFKKKCSQKQ